MGLLATLCLTGSAGCSDDGLIDLDLADETSTAGDGDGDASGDGDGDASGDGDGDASGDGDGDASGDGDGDDPATTNGDGDGDDSTTNGDGDGSCESNEDCGPAEVCVDSLCIDANAATYEVRVLEYTPPDCSDGIGGAEIAYYAYGDEQLIYESSESSCPAAWPGEFFVYNPPEVFQIDFWELDTFQDDLLIALCFQDEFMQCTQVPVDILHDGVISVDAPEAEIEMVFIPM